jgi:gamma-glutamyl-gamma-aminobutyrate hydrolase PuuD
VTPARWSSWDEEAVLVPAAYVSAVERAGGRPVLIPPSEDGVEETLDAISGLVLSGGSDLDPDLYDQDPHEETLGVVPERDRAELALLDAALARDMPVLAVCRGSKVLNVARGGDLVQHLPDVVGDDKHKHTSGTFADHAVTLEPGTRLPGCSASGRR